MAKYLIIDDENFIINLDLIESIKHNETFKKTYFNQQFARDGEEPYYVLDDPKCKIFGRAVAMIAMDEPFGIVEGLPKAGDEDDNT